MFIELSIKHKLYTLHTICRILIWCISMNIVKIHVEYSVESRIVFQRTNSTKKYSKKICLPCTPQRFLRLEGLVKRVFGVEGYRSPSRPLKCCWNSHNSNQVYYNVFVFTQSITQSLNKTFLYVDWFNWGFFVMRNTDYYTVKIVGDLKDNVGLLGC